jgi:steroid 5-alpha reductase family enzyme
MEVEMGFFEVYAIGGAAILAAMVLLWLLSLRIKDASIVDIFWGAGFVLSAWVYFSLAPEGNLLRKLLLVSLVSIWGLRLSIHIGRRNLGKGEDYRYQQWRKEHGARWWWVSFFQVFLLQGFLMWIISAPLLAAQWLPGAGRLTGLDAVGALVWLVGFLFEALGDAQLARFRADPANKGRLLETGLWRYTRHPNYFGDAVQWWGFYLLALAAGGWWTVFSPLVMTSLLRFVSGVALLERNLKNTKPGYAEYAARTNAFFPWFPKERG